MLRVSMAAALALAISAGCCEAASEYELLRTLPSLHGFVNSLAIDQDGTVLAIASDSGAVTLWDVGSGEAMRTLGGHGGAVYTVAFGPNGRLLATGGLDSTARLWDAVTGRELHSLKGHIGWINAVAFAADGTQLLSAGRDSSLRIWDVATGRELRVIDDYSSEVFTVAASPNGRWLASDKGDSFCIREIGTAHEISEGASAQWGINTIVFSPASDELMSAGYDGKLWVWNIAEHKVVRTVVVEGGPVISIAIRPDGLLLALLCSGDRTIKFLDTRTWTETARLPGVAYPTGSVVFSGDGNVLAAGGGDSPVRIWRRQ